MIAGFIRISFIIEQLGPQRNAVLPGLHDQPRMQPSLDTDILGKRFCQQLMTGCLLPRSLPELQGGQAAVHTVWHRLQFLVGAGFHHPPARDDDDAIHVSHRGESVGNDE